MYQRDFFNEIPDNCCFNNHILLNNKKILDFINQDKLNDHIYLDGLKFLKNLENGGFNHGDMSGIYVAFQNNERYKTTRYKGWQNLFRLMLYGLRTRDVYHRKTLSIIDFLSGSGTLSKRLKALWKQRQKLPTVLGIDISEKMCQLAYENGETVFWGSYDNHCFKTGVADVVIAAYGTHHIPYEERNMFINSAHNVLGKHGVCLIHDFLEGHPSACWYSEIIDKYRIYGHNYKHFTEEEMLSLLSKDFQEVEIQFIYDPFCLVGIREQNESSLKQEFFSYLISFFNLSKLLPEAITFKQLFGYTDQSYWKNIEKIFSPYFKISKHDVEKINHSESLTKDYKEFFHSIEVPIFNNLTVYPLPSDPARLCLVAPRIALVGIGYKR